MNQLRPAHIPPGTPIGVQIARTILVWIAAAILGVILFIAYAALRAQPAFADSTQVTILPPVVLDVYRDGVNGEAGRGYHTMANRQPTGRTFTDHVLVRNNSALPAQRFTVRGYFSSPTLTFAGWAGVGANADAWQLGPDGDSPSHYVASFTPSLPIEPGGVAEFTIIFEVKPAQTWAKIKQPQAVHYVFATSYYTNGAAMTAEDETQSGLLVVNPNLGYGWGGSTNEFAFYKANLDGSNERLQFKADLGAPFNVTSTDLDVVSTIQNFGAFDPGCGTQIRPDIRTGTVVIKQGECTTGTGVIYPFLNKEHWANKTGDSYVSAGIGNPTASGLYWSAWGNGAGDLYVTIIESGDAAPVLELSVPRTQMLELAYNYPGSEPGGSIAFWHNGISWTIGTARSGSSNEATRSNLNLNRLTIANDGKIIYNELPFRKPPA